MQSEATSVAAYISQIPEDRKAAVSRLRTIILENLPEGFEEGINYKMIGYYVPHSKYPEGYHCDPKLPLPFMNIASQKNSINIYHNGIYADKKILDWFVREFPKHSSRKLDMGKSCIRFKKIDEIPYELIGELVSKMTVDEWIAIYEMNVKNRK